MEFKIEKLPQSKIVLKINLGADEMKKYADKAIAHFAEHIEIKGFRAGKAPKHLVEQHVGESRIDDETINTAIEDSYTKIIVDNKIDVVAYPKIDVLKFVPKQELEFKAEVDVMPEVKLPDFRQIAKEVGEKDRQEVKVEDKEIKDAIDWLLNSRAKYQKVERPSQKGDLVVASYELRSDGVKIENGDQKEHPFVLGEGKLIPGFEDQIVGMKVGEEKEFTLDVPGDFVNKNIAGKKIDIKAKIDDVMERELPKFDDEFAKSLGSFENVAALEKNIKEGMTSEKEQAEKERFRIVLVSKIAEKSEMDIPEAMVGSEIHKMMHELEHDIQHRGMEFDKYLEHIKKTKEDLEKEFRDKALERVKISLVIREIGKAEEVKISDEEITEKTREVLTKFDGEKKDVDPQKLYDYATNILTNEKVFELLEKYSM